MGKSASLIGEALQVVSLAIVTTNCRESAEVIVVMIDWETSKERRTEQIISWNIGE